MNRKPDDVPSRGERRSVGRLALVLWIAVAVVLAAVAVPTLGAAVDGSVDAGTVAPAERATDGSASATADRDTRTERRAERAAGIVERFFPGAEFSFDFGRGSGLDFGLGTDAIDVRFLDLGGDDGRQTGTISHGAIDEGVARSSGAGLCAAGLRGANSPVAFHVDPENSSVAAELASKPAEDPNRTAALEPVAVVRSCANATA